MLVSVVICFLFYEYLGDRRLKGKEVDVDEERLRLRYKGEGRRAFRWVS